MKNGHLLGTFLQHFLLDRVHLIGFSLGAHIAGIAGQLYEGQILRITGLDPANPWPLVKAHNYPQSEKLDKGDALNVDIIHTSHLGYVTPQGDADFYVNRLKRQPGCSHANMRCYHKRSLDYFAESILSYEKFKTMECESFGEYRKGNCTNETDVYMGESWPQSGGKRGIFCINLNETAVDSYLEEEVECEF
ncbi:lipase member H-like isoform X2 [Agrilus planipennis]|uniref:Lipase member H-like isoform X2 n=1 Tax=Agrilus planipennis TaxID=224129 RepID=A0A7F5RML3_AGRPL|nr:lipase member H-like isoform X2 [Agrilus planipennis]